MLQAFRAGFLLIGLFIIDLLKCAFGAPSTKDDFLVCGAAAYRISGWNKSSQ